MLWRGGGRAVLIPFQFLIRFYFVIYHIIQFLKIYIINIKDF